MNENFESLNFASVYGKRHPDTTGLTWAYWGGRWGGFSVANGTLTLTNTADNYVVVARADGATTVSTTTTNWNNPAAYARVYKLTVAGNVVTVEEDHRAGPNGIHGSVGTGAGTIGRHAVPVMAAAMRPSVTGGCAALAAIASASNQPDIVTLDFDQTTVEYAQFSIPMPKSWNEGTVTFAPIWSHASGGSAFGVVWSLQAVAASNDDGIAAAFGTAQTSADTGGAANDLYRGPESSAITIAGTPAAEDVVFFRISRAAGDGGDTLDLDARLHGIALFITTDAETDA